MKSDSRRHRFSLLVANPLVLAAVVILGSTFAALAQTQPDETLPGFKTNNVLESRGIDNVNILSGDDGIVMPLGPKYALGPAVQWQLKAYHSNKFWEMIDDEICTQNGNGAPEDAYLVGLPTIGVGWTLSMGYSGASGYVSPDGASHAFDSNGFALDNTRLRTTCVTGANPCEVDFPDGTVHHFSQAFSKPVPTSGTSPDFVLPGQGPTGLALTSITDSFGHTAMTVNYLVSPSWAISTIYLNGTTSSSPTITFTWTTKQIGTVTWNVLDHVTLPILQNIPPPASGTMYETVNFAYNPSAFFRRSAFDNTATKCVPGGNDHISPANAYPPVLSQVLLTGPTDQNHNTANVTFATYTFTTFALTTADIRNGAVTDVTLPTGGTVDYTLGLSGGFTGCTNGPPAALETNDTPTGCSPILDPALANCHFCSFLSNSPFIQTRLEKDASGTTLSTVTYGRSTYVPSTFPASSFGDGKMTRVVKVTEPTGNGSANRLTRYMFHLMNANGEPTNAPTLGAFELEHASYVDTNVADPVRTVVDCMDITPGPPANPCGYLGNGGTGGAVTVFPDTGNLRSQGTVAWYGGKPSAASGGSCPTSGFTTPCLVSLQTAWDGTALTYKTSTTTSSPAGVSRTTTKVTDPKIDSTHWLLDLIDSRATTDATGGAPASVTQGFCYYFNAATQSGCVSTDSGVSANGFLYKTTNTDGNGTVTTTFTPDANGNPTTIARAGSGSGMSITTFTDTLNFQNGLAINQKRSPFTWFSFNATRDAAAGLVTASSDPNSLSTSYVYDGLGRFVTVTPPGSEASTSISYDSATQTTVSRSGADGNSTWQRYAYDNFGRLTREIRQMLAGYSVRLHSYDAAGNEFFTSEWNSCTDPSASGDCQTVVPTLGTTLSSFDPFGRPEHGVKADGTTSDFCRDDPAPANEAGCLAAGSVHYSDTVEAATINSVGGAAAMTVTTKDLLGRIVKVTEPPALDNRSNQTVADVTTYGFNVLDKVTNVTQTDSEGSPVTQTRTFLYDTRGVLRQEIHPENGTTTYASYDALGDVLSMTKGSPLITYTSTYDTAGRITQLSTNEASSPVYLQNTYDQTGRGSSLGKLTTRIGNVSNVGTTTVTDSMYYSGLNGRLSQKTSAFGNTVVASVSETWSYNSLGLIATHGHPAIGSPDTVANYSYLLGYPTSLGVGGTCASGALCLVTSATYNPSGGLSSWTAGNGIVTTIVQDLNSMPRPSRIYSAGLDTGTYSYDGAGNITAIGSNAYGYDKRSRVLSGQGETYGYDRFGNLMKVDGATIAIAPQTNRLTTGYSYDALGNVLTSPTAVYTYDGLSRQKAYTAASVAETYLYDGANERIARINPATNTSDDTRVLAVSAPASMNAGATATVTVTMLNTGTTTWTLAAGFQLGAYDPQDNTRFGFNRVSLGSGDSIAPGQQKTFSFTITAPVIPGDYGSQWRMVHNGVAWFGEPSGEKMISVNSTTATYTLAKFYTIVPCRVLDTRQPTGPYGGPALSGGTPRVLDVRGGATTNCSVTIPPSVAVVGNLTAINPLTSGSISIAPDGTEFPTDTSFFPGAKVRATNFITGLAGGKVDLLYEGGLTANVTLDVSGYFKNPASPPPSAPLAVSQRLKPSFPDSPTGTVPPNHLPDAATLAASRSPQAITSGFWNLTFREDQNRLSSEYFAFPSSSTRLRDYFYFGNLLVSTRDTSGSYLFYAADHLGTPRVVTDGYGVIEDAHTYLPYGKEVTTPATSTALSFASMERDSRSGNDFDHARYSLTTMGRFLGVDKVGGHPSNPQTWNRYAYARNNPLKFNDPNGLETNPVTGGSGIADSDIRTTATNPNIGRFGDTRFDGDGDPKFHGGDDLVAEAGTPLHAPVGGTAQVFTTKEGGLIVAIVTTRDGQSIRESIAHLSSASVKTGEKVSEGQIVARSGSTGNAKGLTGSQQHTHLSVRVNGELVDPQPYFGAHPSQATPPLPQSGCGSVGFVGPCQTMQSTTEGGPPTV